MTRYKLDSQSNKGRRLINFHVKNVYSSHYYVMSDFIKQAISI